MAKALMIQGTGSGVGKSIMVAALCRIFKQDGFSVAPFKAQNMALNSFVTSSGGEMGRAQVVQAQASGIRPEVEMNPVLLKPAGNTTCQVIVMGKSIGNMDAIGYHNFKKLIFPKVRDAFERLRKRFELIVIEGAGSPAEINLKSRDIVNMKIAAMARAPVILVGDIDRGGVFAWLYGTLALLSKREKAYVEGVIINKFRGDLSILEPGLRQFSRLSKLPVLGVVPYFNLHIHEEDSLPERRKEKKNIPVRGRVRIEVIRLPHMSNFTDFDSLEREKCVSLRYVKEGEKLGEAEAYIIPGSKNTLGDLAYLKKSGLAGELLKAAKEGRMVIGICGGYQMMGKIIIDPGYETSGGKIEGLGMLDTKTTFFKNKITFQVKARMLQDDVVWTTEDSLEGYEIHMGRTVLLDSSRPLFKIEKRGHRTTDINDGGISCDGRIWGTYIHGIFDNTGLRRSLIRHLGALENLGPVWNHEEELDRLAGIVRQNVRIDRIYEILRRCKNAGI